MSPFLYPHLLSLSLLPPHPAPRAQDWPPSSSPHRPSPAGTLTPEVLASPEDLEGASLLLSLAVPSLGNTECVGKKIKPGLWPTEGSPSLVG